MLLESLIVIVTLSRCILGQCLNGNRIIGSGLSQNEINDIVNIHNELRQKVALGQVASQPAARDMMQVSWDPYLQTLAQNWANRCVFKHSRVKTPGSEPIGENLLMGWASHSSGLSTVRSMVQSWFDEVKLGYNGVFTEQTGHYSQVVWGRTTKIGCGLTFYGSTAEFQYLFVCNYLQAGNYPGQPPYTYGQPPCSAPGRNLVPSRHYAGLCNAK